MTLKCALKVIGKSDCQECTWDELVQIKRLMNRKIRNAHS